MSRPLLALLALAACSSPPTGAEDASTAAESSSGPPVETSSGDLPEDSTSTGEDGSSGLPTGETTTITTGELTEPATSTGQETTTSTGSSSGSESSGSTGSGAECGDGAVDPGEACDDGKETKLCDDDCSAVACGDAHVNAAAGEECDDGNVDETDGCRSSCKLPFCGDGTVDPDEACDDGNVDPGDGCDPDCTPSWWEHEGVAYDVPVANLKGWTLCWEWQFNQAEPQTLTAALKACPGEHLLVGCAPKLEKGVLQMAAHGPRAEVTTPAGLMAPHPVNGAQWVYSSSWFGFSPPGVDMETEGPSVVWGMSGYTIAGTSICEDFNVDGTYRRVIFTR